MFYVEALFRVRKELVESKCVLQWSSQTFFKTKDLRRMSYFFVPQLVHMVRRRRWYAWCISILHTWEASDIAYGAACVSALTPVFAWMPTSAMRSKFSRYST